MLQDNNVPVSWLRVTAMSLQWPVVVAAAFFGGRYIKDLEGRLCKAEDSLEALVRRHMPQIHRALNEIRLLLTERS